MVSSSSLSISALAAESACSSGRRGVRLGDHVDTASPQAILSTLSAQLGRSITQSFSQCRNPYNETAAGISSIITIGRRAISWCMPTAPPRQLMRPVGMFHARLPRCVTGCQTWHHIAVAVSARAPKACFQRRSESPNDFWTACCHDSCRACASALGIFGANVVASATPACLKMLLRPYRPHATPAARAAPRLVVSWKAGRCTGTCARSACIQGWSPHLI